MLRHLLTYFSICSSRSGEVLGSRKDFKMNNNVSIDMLSACVVLDAQSMSLVTVASQHPQPQPQHAVDAPHS